MRSVRNAFIAAGLLLLGNMSFAQQLRLGKSPLTLQKSAILELESENQGLLFPRITDTTLINSLTPPDGMVIYHVPSRQLMVRSNGHWEAQATGTQLGSYWNTNGNTTGSIKKLGTLDNYDLSVITNNAERIRILANGNVGIGNSNPLQKLDVTGNFNLSGAFMPGNNAGTSGQVLRSNGINAAATWTNFALSNLSDVTITSPINGQLLQYNGTRWVNTTPTYLTSIDTTNISNFHIKVKSLLSAGTGINYNAGTGAISNNGVLSVNGNNGAITIDTNYIANFHLKSKSLLSAGAGISYNAGTGAITNNGVRSLNGNTGALTMDTGYIANFHLKTKSLLSAGTGINYNPATGVISAIAGGVTSLNGNTGALTMDTGYIANFHLKTKSLFNAGTGITYNAATGTITNNGVTSLNGNTGAITMDTGYIANFHLKTKSLLSAGTGISYNATTGVISSSVSPTTLWSLTGNTGINPATNFLGTTDDKQLVLKSNNSPYVEMGRRQTLGLTQGYTDYTDNDEQVMHMKSAVQFYAPAAQFYKPKIFVDANGNFRTKGSSAGTDYFEFGATGTNNDGGFEFIIGDDGDEPILFKSYNYQTGMSEIMRLQSGRMAVGSNSFDATNPEKLLIDAGVTNSYNLMTGKGSINNYLQINVQNRSNGNTASSDIVATSDNGSESVNYIDMGINSSGFNNNTYPILDGVNNAYLYSTGNDFSIGNGSSGRNLRFFTGGFTAAAERMRIDGSGNIGVATTSPSAKLDVAGTTKLGTNGTVNKNVISFESTLGSASAVPSASMTVVLPNSFTPGALELNVTIPSPNPTSTRASVVVSADRDLPSNVSIASARLSATNTVKIRFINGGTAAQSLASGTKLYITITEF